MEDHVCEAEETVPRERKLKHDGENSVLRSFICTSHLIFSYIVSRRMRCVGLGDVRSTYKVLFRNIKGRPGRPKHR
jgi:hypothetical protein